MYRTTPFFTTKSTAPTITVSAAPSTDVQSCSVPMSTNCSATKSLLVPSFTYGKGNKGRGDGGRGGGRLNRASVPQSAQLIGGGGPETCWTKQTRALEIETPLVTEETRMCLVDGVDVKNDEHKVGTVLNNNTACSPPLLSPTPAERLELSLLLALLHDFSLNSAEEKDASGRIIGDRHGSNGEKKSTNTAAASATARTTCSTSSGGGATCVRSTTHTTGDELIAPYVREWVKGMGVPFRDNSFSSSSSFSSVQQTSKTGGCQRVPSGPSGPLAHRTQPSTAIRGRPQPQPRHTSATTNINKSSINPQAGRIYCLKHYNSVKDAAQHIFGLVAQSRGVELSQLYFEEGISDE